MTTTEKTTPIKQFNVPQQWADHYTEANREAVAAIIEWLNARGKTMAWAARLSRVHPSTLSSALAGRYNSDPGKFLDAVRSTLKTQEERLTTADTPYVETGVYQLAAVICDRARTYANFGVLSGNVGVGKTSALRQYTTTTPNTFMIEADPDMTPGVLLNAVLDAANAPKVRSVNDKFAAAVLALKGSSSLLIVDEAETMMPKTLHYLRRIRDKAGIGVVLSGTQNLMTLIKPEFGQFDQVRSRVGFWPTVIRGISREDADAIATAALADQGDISQGALDALWHYCRGSARMLVENFLPALRDYGLGNYELDGDLVDTIAEKVLNMQPRGSRQKSKE